MLPDWIVQSPHLGHLRRVIRLQVEDCIIFFYRARLLHTVIGNLFQLPYFIRTEYILYAQIALFVIIGDLFLS